MSRSILDPRLCFVCEFLDDIAHLTRELQLLYFYKDNSVELTEVKSKKVFLRRISVPGLSREQFYLGGTVMVFGRIMKLTAFGDEVTRQLCEESAEYTTIVLQDSLLPRIGSVLAILTEECSFGVKAMRTVIVREESAAAVGLPSSFVGRPVVVVQAVRRQALTTGLEFASRIGKQAVVAQDAATAEAWTGLLNEPSSVVQGEYNSSVVIVKPHALQKTLGGAIIQMIVQEAGVTVSAVRSLSQSTHDVDHLLQPYKGVLVDYSATVSSIAGNSWIVQCVGKDGVTNVQEAVRRVCGPFEPSIAKALVPTSVRARYGVDRVFNAVHCTDVPADAIVYAATLFR